MLHNLFPQPIGFYKLDRDLSEQELLFIKNQKTRKNKGNLTSEDSSVLKRKELKNIRDFIETSIADYFQTVYSPKHKVSLNITQSWCNYTEKNQWHHRHSHPNSFVSGVFYPQANKEKDKIYFFRELYKQITFPPTNWNMYNSDSWWFEVGTGDLILFPSSIEHMVEAMEEEHTRISLSFNTFPVGNIGEESDLAGLQIGDVDGTFC